MARAPQPTGNPNSMQARALAHTLASRSIAQSIECLAGRTAELHPHEGHKRELTLAKQEDLCPSGSRLRSLTPPPIDAPPAESTRIPHLDLRKPEGSSLPMIGDWDTGWQPAVALREPMAQRGERKSMWEAWLCGSVFRRDPCLIEDGGSGRKPLLQKPSFCRSGFSRDHCAIEDGGLGLKSLFTKHGTLPRLNRSCDEREGSLRPSPIIQRHEPTGIARTGKARLPPPAPIQAQVLIPLFARKGVMVVRVRPVALGRQDLAVSIIAVVVRALALVLGEMPATLPRPSR
jgi:hypothetical protein